MAVSHAPKLPDADYTPEGFLLQVAELRQTVDKLQAIGKNLTARIHGTISPTPRQEQDIYMGLYLTRSSLLRSLELLETYDSQFYSPKYEDATRRNLLDDLRDFRIASVTLENAILEATKKAAQSASDPQGQ